jgi:hypothetical protein
MAGEDGFTNGRGGGALQVEMAMEEGKMFSTSNRGGEKSFPSPAEQLKFPPTQPESDRLYNLAVNNLSYKVSNQLLLPIASDHLHSFSICLSLTYYFVNLSAIFLCCFVRVRLKVNLCVIRHTVFEMTLLYSFSASCKMAWQRISESFSRGVRFSLETANR